MGKGLIVNIDDDYHMDEHEELRELEESFMEQIRRSYANDEFPFASNHPEQKALANRVFDLVKSPVEDVDVFLVIPKPKPELATYRCVKPCTIRLTEELNSTPVGQLYSGDFIVA